MANHTVNPIPQSIKDHPEVKQGGGWRKPRATLGYAQNFLEANLLPYQWQACQDEYTWCLKEHGYWQAPRWDVLEKWYQIWLQGEPQGVQDLAVQAIRDAAQELVDLADKLAA